MAHVQPYGDVMGGVFLFSGSLDGEGGEKGGLRVLGFLDLNKKRVSSSFGRSVIHRPRGKGQFDRHCMNPIRKKKPVVMLQE